MKKPLFFDFMTLTILYSVFKVHTVCFRNCEMEIARFELATPCLQGRCSPNWAKPPKVIIFYFFIFCYYSTFFAKKMGSSGLEPPTSRLSGARSNRLSYEPILFSGNHLLSQAVSHQVSSAACVLTNVFEMGTGVSHKRIITRDFNQYIVLYRSLKTEQFRNVTTMSP